MANAAPTQNPAPQATTNPAPATAAPVVEAPVKMVPVRLKRNYRPGGVFEVVGWHRPEKKQKGPTGAEIIVQTAEFIVEKDDDPTSANYGKVKPAPAVQPGTGTTAKLWASTVIRVPVDEAKAMRKADIGDIEIDEAA